MGWRSALRCSTTCLLAAWLTLPPRIALAQASADTAADRAFNEALSLMDAGRYREACSKLEESERLEPASGTLLNLADCYEHLGRIGSAWKTFEDAARLAKANGKHERERVARERAANLVPRLSLVVLVPPKATPELSIELDGAVLASGAWSSPLVVDAGAHALVVRAPRRLTFSTQLGPVAQGATLEFRIPELTPVTSGESAESSADAPAVRRPVDGQRLAAVVSAGVAAAGFIAGTAFGLHSLSRHDESDRYCDGNLCSDARGVTAMQDARVAGNRATAGFIVGGVGLAAASVLWFVRPFSSRPSSAQIGFGVTSLTVRGQF